MALNLTLFLFNRATYARMKAFIGHCLAHGGIDLRLALSSSLLWDEFGDAAAYIEKCHPKAKIDKLPIERTSFDHAGMARAQAEIARVVTDYLVVNRPQVAMVVADRYETDPTSMVLASLAIPTIHVQGGEITGNIDEKVRHSITKRSDYHFAATQLAAKYIEQMGEESERVFHTGCPSIDLIRVNNIGRAKGCWHHKPFMMTIFHPETEAVDRALEQTKIVMESVLAFCKRHEMNCEWFYPNPDPGRKKIADYLDETLAKHPEILTKAVNREPEEFLKRLAQSSLIVGNSSCLIRESSYLGTPAVLIGDRQAIRERGFNVMEVEYDSDAITQAMDHQRSVGQYKSNRSLFGFGKARHAMLDILLQIHRGDGFSIKGPLTYPAWPQFRGEHFGISTNDTDQRSQHSTAEPVALQS